jgi:hypothetical protein
MPPRTPHTVLLRIRTPTDGLGLSVIGPSLVRLCRKEGVAWTLSILRSHCSIYLPSLPASVHSPGYLVPLVDAKKESLIIDRGMRTVSRV